MKRKNTTRNALFTSIMSLLLCVSMLVGTTFAWFTDSVTSGINTIAAGNLDVELYHGKDQSPVDRVKEDTLLFTDVGGNVIDQWEPGVVAYTNLKVANVGTLALKYQLSINSTETNYVQYADGSIYTLADALKVAVVKDGVSGDRAAVVAAGVTSGWEGLKSFTLSGELNSKEESDTYGIVIYWEPGENDNLFNMNNGKVTSDGEALTITLGVNLFATQEMYEDDSFGDDYDKLAPWAGKADTEWYNETATEFTITSAEELAGLAQLVNSGSDTFTNKTIKLAANIDLNDAPWTPIGNDDNLWANKFDGTFIGTGYTISNLYVTGTSGLGLFGYVGDGAHIEGVTIDGAYVSGTDYVGAVLGSGYLAENCLINCTVKNAEIIAMPYLKADGVTYDGGAKAGAVAGHAINGNITGNKAINCTVTAYRDLGGIAGMVSGEDRAVTVSGNTVDTVKLVYLNMNGAAMHEGKVNENMGDIVGRVNNVSNNTTIATDNTVTNVTRTTDITYMIDGVWYRKNVDANTVKLFAVTDDAPAVLRVPEGVTHLGTKILQGNTKIKEVEIPASVIDFGGTVNANGQGATGGMFYKSAVEKITLPEGLTEIPAAAFNQADKLTSVNIPASVEKIGINAFAGTGLETLTVPATVKEIGYGAFRDMDKLTTATIEGDVCIPGYAFRDCSALKAVYLKGENVTFGSNMIFTVSSTNNENPNGITVYVANDAVKEKLEATNQFKGTIIVTAFVSTAAELADAVAKGATNLYLADGMYDIYGCSGKTLIISGSKNAVIKIVDDGESGLDACFDGSTVTFNGVTFDSTENTASYKGFTRMTGIYNDCVFVGEYCTSNYTHTFNNCYFETKGYIWTWGAEAVTFNNCEFGGDSRNILAHGGASTVIDINNCKFAATEKGYTTWNPPWTAAVEIDPTGTNTYTITIDDSTINDNYSGWTRIKDGSTGHTITVDGKKFVSDGLYTDNEGNYYVYNATGLMSLNSYFANNKMNNAVWGRNYNIMADIDATGYTWNNVYMITGTSEAEGINLLGNGHTISNLTITGGGMLGGTPNCTNSEYPAYVKNLTFNNVTVTGDAHFAGIVWGGAAICGDVYFEDVHVVNSSVSGKCNVGALIGGTGEQSASYDLTIAFKDCSVEDTTLVATGNSGADPTGASAFIGRAYANTSLVFEGENVAKDNTITNNNGLVGGGIYGYTIWAGNGFVGTGKCDTFTNWGGLTAASDANTLKAVNGGNVALTGTVDLGGTQGNYLTLTEDTTITGGTIKGTGWTGELNYAVNATSGNIVFDGVTFDTTDWTTEGSAQWGISVNVNGDANVTFKNCTFKGPQCPIYQSGANSVITLENCKFETASVAIQCEVYSGDFSLGQDLIIKNCDFTGVADVLHIYDYDKDPTSEAIARYLTDNGNTFTGVCKQTCN